MPCPSRVLVILALAAAFVACASETVAAEAEFPAEQSSEPAAEPLPQDVPDPSQSPERDDEEGDAAAGISTEAAASRALRYDTLYDAYNQLHTYSQQFGMSIDSPAVVVVGQQTDGKSALIEALMGFQFNHVGGGTKTRRPIALQMQYNRQREQPRCFLQAVGGERVLSLADLQAHIQRENQRLEEANAFDPTEIIVRIEYRYCPNLIIIDTPGLLASAGADATGDKADLAEQQAAAVEQLVLTKLRPSEHIVLCVEETTNWQLAPARSLVCRADRELRRTVVVSTKLDIKFPQFGAASELRQFLAAGPLHRRHPALLGGPFFTSVPAGRVGGTSQHHFSTNEDYQDALTQLEEADRAYVRAMLGHADTGERADDASLVTSLGVGTLRAFLEERLRERYLANLASIIPQLRDACERVSADLRTADASLENFTPEKLRALCSKAASELATAVDAAVKGSASSEASGLGQTLEQEQAEAGALVAAAAAATASADDAAVAGAAYPRQPLIDGAEASLFGGAQYHRLLREFEAAVRHLPARPVSEEDVLNQMGIDAQHDTLHAARAACVIAMAREAAQLHALLDGLVVRLRHVMRRMLKLALVIGDGDEPLRVSSRRSPTLSSAPSSAPPLGRASDSTPVFAIEALVEPRLQAAMRDAYTSLLERLLSDCRGACLRDLSALTASDGGSSADVSTLYPLLVDPGRPSTPVEDPEPTPANRGGARRSGWLGGGGGGAADAVARPAEEEDDAWAPSGWFGSSVAVDTLVTHVVSRCRQQFGRAVKRKVHSLFLLNFLEELPSYLTRSLHARCDPESLRSLDISEAREQLQLRRQQLVREQEESRQLLRKFHNVRTRLGSVTSAAHAAKAMPSAMPSPA